ncbi:hypothetical protein K1719_011531 [Acacia pycnantha]|nr:hypothetical protein K1719_011531 [Acacia pycnantha]
MKDAISLALTSDAINTTEQKVDSDFGHAVRTHQDIINGQARHHGKSCTFYKRVSKTLFDASVVLDLFACSLDEVGIAEL